MVEKKAIEELRSLKANKECFDCREKGTTYIVSNFGVFVCSKCSGLHRDLNHKVKGIGVSNFTPLEISFLQRWGNENAKDVWLATFPKGQFPESGYKDIQRMKDHLKAVFELKKYYKESESMPEKDKDSQKEDPDNSKKPSKVVKQQTKPIAEPQKPIKQMKMHELFEVKPTSPVSKSNVPNLLEMEENAGSQAQKNDSGLLNVDVNLSAKESKISNDENWAKVSLPNVPIKPPAPEKKEEKMFSNLKELYNESFMPQIPKIQEQNIGKKDPFGNSQMNMMGNLGFNQPNMRSMNSSQIQTLVFQNVSNFCSTYGIPPQQYYMAMQAMFTPKVPTFEQPNSQLRSDKNEIGVKQDSKPGIDASNPFDLLV